MQAPLKDRYVLVGMNGATYGGHSPEDVASSTSFATLAERRSANLQRPGSAEWPQRAGELRRPCRRKPFGRYVCGKPELSDAGYTHPHRRFQQAGATVVLPDGAALTRCTRR